MKKSYDLRQQDFDTLLGLFSEDREEAGRRYEKLREGLVRFFEFRGCDDAEFLADETFDRVASKASVFDPASGVHPTAYIYGFARMILLEYLRNLDKRELQLDGSDPEPSDEGLTGDEGKEADNACLEKCLNELSPADRSLVLEYFSRERGEKIEVRRKMAERLGCGSQVIQSRVFRIKRVLRNCICRCREENA